MYLDDIKEAIRIKKDGQWFIDYFEVNIEDLVERFADLIEENKEDLPTELGMVEEMIDYEDRE